MIVLAYITAIAASNILVAAFGPSFTIANAFFFIGVDFVLRDKLHDSWCGQWLWPKMAAMVASAGVASYAMNPSTGQIAVASVAAFCLAAAADAAVYHAMSSRCFLARSNVSNAAGSLIDSFVFPAIAFGAFVPDIVAGQFVAKVAGGALWAAVLHGFRREVVR